MCFVLYYYQVINLVISDLKTSKSLISNARPGLRVEWKCPTPGMCFTGKWLGEGEMGTLGFG
jgi:hypothetical protein